MDNLCVSIKQVSIFVQENEEFRNIWRLRSIYLGFSIFGMTEDVALRLTSPKSNRK